MASLPPFIRRRFLSSSSSTTTTTTNVSKKWAVKEVTKSNFSESLEEFKDHLSCSDFVAVSLQKTGSYRAPWHRPQPFDTAETSYFKAKYAAERFQLLQFAACPFSLRASKLTPYPYNFVLFPRDELKMGMPTYSFSVQTSHLTSMAEEDALLSSLRKIVMGSEIYGTTPCMNLDVCSKLQVQLALEMLNEFSDELVPLIIPAKLGGCSCCFDKF